MTGNQPPVTQDFGYMVVVSPRDLVLQRGGNIELNVAVKAMEAQYENVTTYLWTADIPTGVTATFTAPTVVATGETRLSLAISPDAPAGRYTAQVILSRSPQGTVGAYTQKIPFTFIIAGNGGNTVLRGRVMTAEANARPLANVTVSANTNPAMQVRTDADGRFTIQQLAAVGHQIINIDGHTADTETETFPVVPIGVDIVPGTTNDVPWTIYLPRIDTANTMPIQQDVDLEQMITPPGLPGAQIVIPPHTVIVNSDGSPVPQITLTPLPGNRLPMPLPGGATAAGVPTVYTLQPGGAVASNPIAITFPNQTAVGPNSRLGLWTVDHDTALFRVYGSGTVAPDGATVTPDLIDDGTGRRFGLSRFSWHFPAACDASGTPPGPDAPSLRPTLRVDSNEVIISPTQSEQVYAYGLLSDGTQPDLTSLCVFASSNNPVARVSPAIPGLISGISKGSATVTATLIAAPPGVFCVPGSPATLQGNCNVLVTDATGGGGGGDQDPPPGCSANFTYRVDSQRLLYTDPGDTPRNAVILNQAPATLRVNLGAPANLVVRNATTDTTLFSENIVGSATIPLTNLRPRNRITLAYRRLDCSVGGSRTCLIFLAPNATPTFTPDPIQIENGRTRDDTQVSTIFDLNFFNPPVERVITRIEKDEQVIGTLGECAPNENCQGTWPAGQEIDPQSSYEIVVVYRLMFTGENGQRVEKVVARKPLFPRNRILTSYRDTIFVRSGTEPGTEQQCSDTLFFTGTLAVPAQVTVLLQTGGVNGSPIFFPVADEALAAGDFSLAPTQLTLQPGEYPFVINARNDQGLVEQGIGVLRVQRVIAGSVWPVGHTFVGGVDITDGHVALSHKDLHIPGRGLSLELTRTYSNTANNPNGLFGPNWSSTYEANVVVNRFGNCEFYNVVTGDGQGQSFRNNFDGTFTPQKGYHGSLELVSNSLRFRTKEGVTYSFKFDPTQSSAWRLDRVSDPNGNELTVTYLPPGGFPFASLLNSVTDASGRRLQFAYSQTGRYRLPRVTSVTGPLGLSVSYQYDDDGNLVTASRSSRAWTYDYLNRPEDQPFTRHCIRRVTDPEGNPTDYEFFRYDDRFTGEGVFPPGCNPLGGNCINLVFLGKINAVKKMIQYPVRGNESQKYETTFEYDVTSALETPPTWKATVTDPRRVKTEYTLNDFGQPIKIVRDKGGLNFETRLTWEAANKTSERDANGRLTLFEYDALGNLTRERIFTPNNLDGQLQAETTYAYEQKFSRLISKTDAVGGRTDYVIDPLNGNLLAVNVSPDPVGMPGRRLFTTTYAYNPDGTLRLKTDARGFETRYEYDLWTGGIYGLPTRMIRQTAATEFLTTTMQYDQRSRMIQEVSPYGLTTSREYNDLDRMIRELVLDLGQVVTLQTRRFTYNGTGLVTIESFGPHRRLFMMDGLNRVTQTEDQEQNPNNPAQFSTVYTARATYDENSNVRTRVDRRGVTTTIDYDSLNRPTAERVTGPFGGPNNGDGVVASMGYDAVGNLKSRADMTGATTLMDYDGLYRLEKKTLPVGNATGQAYTERRTYDAVGNLRTITDANGNTTRMDYDRLSRVIRTTDAVNRIAETDYEADTASPHVSRDVTAGTTRTMVYDGVMRPLSDRVTFTEAGQPVNYVKSYAYDDVRNAVVETDARGKRHESLMDRFGRVVEKGSDIDGLNLRTRMAYDDRGNLTRATDPEGSSVYDPERTTTYEYDFMNRQTRMRSNGNLTGSATRYDGEGLVTEATGTDQTLRRMVYDNLGRVLTLTEGSPQLSRTTQTNYLDQFTEVTGAVRAVSVTDAKGRIVRTAMDGLGRAVQVDDGLQTPLARTKRMDYDGVNLRVARDWLGRETRMDYDAANRVTGVTDALSRVVSTNYNDAARSVTVVDARGIATTTDADAIGRPVRVTRVGTGGETVIPERMEYDANGNVTRRLDAEGNETTFGYDGANRLVQTVTGTGAQATTVLTEYDRAGNVTATINGRLTHRYALDVLGRRLTDVDGVGRVTRLFYNASGTVNYSIDPYGDARGFGYDALNRLTTVWRGNEAWTQYEYSPRDERVADIRPDKTVRREFDPLGRLTRETEHADGEPSSPALTAQTFTYDANDNLSRLTDAKGQVVESSYDLVNRLETKNYLNAAGIPGQAVTSQYAYLYDANDAPVEVGETRTDGQRRFRRMTYDGLQRVATTTDVYGKTNTYEYIATGQRSRRVDANGDVTNYGYDDQSRLSEQTTGGRTTTWSYANDGLLSGIARTGGLATTYDYDDAGRISRVSNTRNGNNVSKYELGYDDGRNRVTLDETFGSANAERTEFQFGLHNQLLEVKYPTYRVEYGYGGPLEARSYEQARGGESWRREYCYGTFGRLTQVTDTRGAKTIDFAYDQNGNRTRKSVAGSSGNEVTDYVYDVRDKLRRVERDGTAVGEYDYDDAGRRISQTTAEGVLRSSYDGDELLNEWTGTLEAKASYESGGGKLLSRREKQGATWSRTDFTWNHLNSTSEVLDGISGNVVTSYRYDAWGNFKNPQEATSNGNRHTFTGQKYDAETGLFAMGNGTRFYDADTGAFTQEDPVYGEIGDPQTMSPYAYARNNPVWYTDPTGMTVWKLLDKATQESVESGKVDRLVAHAGYNRDTGEGEGKGLREIPFRDAKGRLTALGEFFANPENRGATAVVVERGDSLGEMVRQLGGSDLTPSEQNDVVQALTQLGMVNGGEAVAGKFTTKQRIDSRVSEIRQLRQKGEALEEALRRDQAVLENGLKGTGIALNPGYATAAVATYAGLKYEILGEAITPQEVLDQGSMGAGIGTGFKGGIDLGKTIARGWQNAGRLTTLGDLTRTAESTERAAASTAGTASSGKTVEDFFEAAQRRIAETRARYGFTRASDDVVMSSSPNAAAKKAVQGQYIDPLTNMPVRTTNTLAADHIIPQKFIKQMPGYSSLTSQQQGEVLNYLNNFQGLPKTFNSSKNAQLPANWATYKGGALHPGYIQRNQLLQTRLTQELQNMIDNFNRLNQIP